ncbi:MAG TPA: hypothetical protein VHE80_11580, partial [Acidimicrobiales bacterium]|nr:hypothetical protein [Acidimicrobiales bacterium]
MLADADIRGAAFCRAHSDLADRWLTDLLGDEDGVALVAVGGYGRRELCPASDLDVVLVHDRRRDVKALAERIWYPIWDAGVGLDHSVRTVKEALRVASEDLKASLGLLDGRLVAGRRDLADDLIGRNRDQWRKRWQRWTEALGRMVAERHAEFGEVAFLLEPELKEGRGGIRDFHALKAAARATPVVEADHPALAEAYEGLVDVRTELHRRVGKPLDRLLLQEQDAVATGLGYADADALMAAVATAARTIAWWSDDGWRRVASARAGPRGRAATRDHAIAPDLLLREDEVVLA